MTPESLHPHLVLPDDSTHPILSSCQIGRSSSNHLSLDADQVSRRHALIHSQGEHDHWLLDLGSSNGTLLNNRPVIQPTKLTDGDTITIGDQNLVFRTPNDSEAAAGRLSLGGSTLVNVRTTRQWILLADIIGFTPLSRGLPPVELARTVGTWLAETRSIVEKHQGQIYKYLGDGWLGGWLDGPDSTSHVASCITGLRALQDSSSLSFRLVVHLGDITSSGSQSSGECGMIGPDLNFAFRMEKLCGSLGTNLILSKAAYPRLSSRFDLQSLGHHALKGFTDTHEFFA